MSSLRDDDEDDFLSNEFTKQVEDSLGYYYIEDSLSVLCEDSTSHSLLRGGHFFQPGFTLLATVLILIIFLMFRRFENVVALCWPTKLEKRADGLVVAASTMSVSDQFALIYQLKETIPSTKGIFPDGNFIDAAKRIADRDLEYGFTVLSKTRSEHDHEDSNEIGEGVVDCEDGSTDGDSTSPPSNEDEEKPHSFNDSRKLMEDQPLEVQRQKIYDELKSHLADRLNVDAANTILDRFPFNDCSRLVESLGVRKPEDVATASIVPPNVDQSNHSQHMESTTFIDTQENESPFLLEKSKWELWQDSAGEKELESWIEEVESWMDRRNESSDRDIALIFLFLEVVVCIWVLSEFYLSEPFPRGDWFYCQLPYAISVVSYKPFAMPMWACITVVCPYTFAEYTFGRHPKGRDASGTCNTSSIPRNAYSVALVFIITALLCVWWAMALFAYALPLVVFSPVLLLPAFVIPFVALYAPTKSLDCAVSRAGRSARQEIREHTIKVGDRVEVCNGTEPWGKGVVTAVDDQGNIYAILDVLPEEEGSTETSRTWDNCRPESAHECNDLHSTFEETIFALRLAATQLIIAVMIAFPVIQFYRTDYSWVDGAKDILGVSFNFNLLFKQLRVSFFWPTFSTPEVQFQFIFGVSIVCAQLFIRLGQFGIRASKLNPWIMLRIIPYGSNIETLVVQCFATISWLPFRASMDRMRSAIDGAVVESKRRETPGALDALVEPEAKLIGAAAKALAWLESFVFRILYCLGMFTCWQPFQSTKKDLHVKAFSANTRDDDIGNFCNGEEALWYTGIVVNGNPHVGQIVPHVYNCIWFNSLKITNCRNVEGNIKDISVWLIDLFHLEVGRVPSSKVPKLVEPLDSYRGREWQQSNRIPWFQGDIVCLQEMKRLVVVNLSWTVVNGDISVFVSLPSVRNVNLNGCTDIQGTIAVFEGTRDLRTCMLGSTRVNGDIRAFSCTPMLARVDLGFTFVKGSISVFRNTRQLVAVNLQHVRCEGSIQVFEATPNIESADLDGVRGLFGFISVFEATPNLESLGLSETSCEGNISVFTHTPRLKVLRLSQTASEMSASSSSATRRFNTKVKGDIDIFRNTPDLRTLNLHASSCGGDIAAFEATPKIHSINLNVNLWRTKAVGDLAVFAASTQLRSLVLARTQVHGNGDSLRADLPQCSMVL